MDELISIVANLAVMGIVVYGLLLMVGAPFGGPKLANRFANWVWGSAIGATLWAIKLPFKTAKGLVFGKKKKKKKKK